MTFSVAGHQDRQCFLAMISIFTLITKNRKNCQTGLVRFQTVNFDGVGG